MKLRIARKVHNRQGQDGYYYRDTTLARANRRYGQTKTWRRTEAFWFGLMDSLGILGRAELVFLGRVREVARANNLPIAE